MHPLVFTVSQSTMLRGEHHPWNEDESSGFPGAATGRPSRLDADLTQRCIGAAVVGPRAARDAWDWPKDSFPELQGKSAGNPKVVKIMASCRCSDYIYQSIDAIFWSNVWCIAAPGFTMVYHVAN